MKKNKWYLKEFKSKAKSLALYTEIHPLPTNTEMQNFYLGRASMAYDILKMLQKDHVIDIGYIQDVISEWDPELWSDK